MSLEDFYNDGFLILENVFDIALIDNIREEAVRNFTAIKEMMATQDLEIGIGTQNGYKEYIQMQ